MTQAVRPRPATAVPGQLLSLGLGIAVGACGAAWILREFERDPAHGLRYHVPLAAAFGCWAGLLLFAARGRSRARLVAATAIGLGLVAARVALQWPLSGHGVLGTLIAARAPWLWLRALALAIVAQALLSKWWAGLDPLSVVWGALAGLALAGLGGPVSAARSAAPG